MNYSEIQDLCERRKTTVSDISCRIGMSYTGFKNSLETGKMNANKVVLLCKELGITPNTFFGWEKIDPVTYVDSNVQNGNNNVQYIMSTVDVLRDQLAAKDSQIAVKDHQIAELFTLLKSK